MYNHVSKFIVNENFLWSSILLLSTGIGSLEILKSIKKILVSIGSKMWLIIIRNIENYQFKYFLLSSHWFRSIQDGISWKFKLQVYLWVCKIVSCWLFLLQMVFGRTTPNDVLRRSHPIEFFRVCGRCP